MSEASIPQSRQHRRTARTRAQLLDAGLRVFLEQGYEVTSAGAITTLADLGAGTFYLHFRDKRAIYEAIVRRELLTLRAAWLEKRKSLAQPGDPSAEVSLMVQMVLESVLRDLTLARLILLDGPPLEKWLLDDIGREMALALEGSVSEPDLVASLVIGATLNVARWSLSRPRSMSTKRLVARAVTFCAAGIHETVGATSRRRG